MMKLATTWLFCLLLSDSAAAAPDTILFAVNEGTSSSTDAVFRTDKYADLARHLSAVVGKNVKMETSNILSIVIRNLERQRYDVLLIRPSHISARAMREQGYRLLVAAKGESKVHFLVKKDSPLKTLKDLEGRRFLYTKDKLPFWSVIVSPKVTEATATKLKQALLNLDKAPEGQEMLKKVGVPGFVEGNQQAYLDMLKWVEGK